MTSGHSEGPTFPESERKLHITGVPSGSSIELNDNDWNTNRILGEANLTLQNFQL